jgi:hypothetical protein
VGKAQETGLILELHQEMKPGGCNMQQEAETITRTGESFYNYFSSRMERAAPVTNCLWRDLALCGNPFPVSTAMKSGYYRVNVVRFATFIYRL